MSLFVKEFIRQTASELGFAAIGVTSAEPVRGHNHLTKAIASGRTAGMNYLARNPAARFDPRTLLAGARSVICLACRYGEEGFLGDCFSCLRRDRNDTGRLRARYARGENYHTFIRSKLEKLREKIKLRAPDARSKFCVDTSPIMEKALAERAGIGWVGKHTIVVNKNFGSWFMLGEIITDIELEPDAPAKNHCGKCTACIEACPTGALLAPHRLDARRCISYLTTELKGEIPKEMLRFVPEGAFGCDICQMACPHNGNVYNDGLSW